MIPALCVCCNIMSVNSLVPPIILHMTQLRGSYRGYTLFITDSHALGTLWCWNIIEHWCLAILISLYMTLVFILLQSVLQMNAQLNTHISKNIFDYLQRMKASDWKVVSSTLSLSSRWILSLLHQLCTKNRKSLRGNPSPEVVRESVIRWDKLSELYRLYTTDYSILGCTNLVYKVSYLYTFWFGANVLATVKHWDWWNCLPIFTPTQ